MMKLKLHSRIKIAVEFSDVGVVKPGGEFEVDETRAGELIQLQYAEPVKKTPTTATRAKTIVKTKAKEETAPSLNSTEEK